MSDVFRRSTAETSPTVSLRRDGVVIRRLREADMPLVLRAQEACRHDLDDALTESAVLEGFRREQLRGILLSAPDRCMMVCYQIQGKSAMLTCGYREGSPYGFKRDAHRLIARLEGELKEWGVTNTYLCLGSFNPKFLRLYDLFKRLGFESDIVRMGKKV